MKNILTYSIVTTVIILISLLLPYESHDLYSGGFFKADVMLRSGLTSPGTRFVSAYLPALFILTCLIIIKLNQNLTTAIISLVVSFGTLIYMAFLAFILQFHLNIFNGPRNYELEIGYYIALWAVITYFVITVIHLIAVIRKRRKPNQMTDTSSNSDILDDVLDF